MKDQVVAFRISNTEYAALVEYASKEKISVSEAVRRAVKWMQILYGGSRR